jgi:hypothetical protein
VAPVCSNCNGSDFVWANELKTGMTGASLSLRSRGEVPLGTRICRTCGHADLFLRDISILHQPHNWRPGEFVPIVPKSTGPKAPTPAPSTPSAPPSMPPPPPPPPPPEPEPVPEPPAPAAAGDAAAPAAPAAEESPKPKASRRRSAKPKSE